MKAKEIIQRIEDNLREGLKETEALTLEVITDFKRMNEQNKSRKGQTAALTRLFKEYNQKWNVVIAHLNTLEAFKINGKSYLQDNDFARIVLQASSKNQSQPEEQLDIILRSKSISNADYQSAVRARQEYETLIADQKRLMHLLYGTPL